MKSPFPGMDPFIETSGLWEEFHSHFIEKLYDAVTDVIPEKYEVRTTRRSYVELVEPEGKEARPFQPDVGISEPGSQTQHPVKSTTASVAQEETDAEVVSLRAVIAEEFREKFIEIYEPDEEGLRLVTCIEVLSPTNKKKDAEGWRQYLRKRQALLMGEANLVELDLLRGGHKMPMVDPWPACPYTLLVFRAERAPFCRVYKAYSLKPLPALPIPLTPPDADLSIPLQPLVDAVYVRGRFHRPIDYTKPPRPPLLPNEAGWLQEQLKTNSATGTPSPSP